MARTAKRFFGPAAGTGADQLAYTAPSGTALGTARGARLRGAVFCNTSGSPGAFSLTIGAISAGTSLLASGSLLAAGETKIFQFDEPLEAGDTLHVSCGTTVATTLSGEEFILGS